MPIVGDCEFQFTHPGGVRPLDVFTLRFDTTKFQFTHPGGVRLRLLLLCRYHLMFQFTHPGGVRRASAWLVHCTDIQVSIHAPGRGATSEVCTLIILLKSFNSRTREGCDYYLIVRASTARVSIHAPGRGATGQPLAGHSNKHCFNSRTREGCDSLFIAWFSRRFWFQFTHPGGVRLGALRH